MMAASVAAGAKEAKLIKYETSGDASGDYSAVVGYAGIVVY
jgi:AmmeMemoRadiSam system protein B